MRHYTNTHYVLNAANAVKGAASNGNGMFMEVSDFRHLILALDTTGSATATIKVQGSISETAPDFTAAQSQSNQWGYIQAIDLADQSVVNGATGFVLTGTDTDRLLEINTNGLKWINVIVTAYTQGTIYAQIKPFNDAI